MKQKLLNKLKNRKLAMFISHQPIRINWPWSTLSVGLHLNKEWDLGRKCMSIFKTMVYLPQVGWQASLIKVHRWVWEVSCHILQCLYDLTHICRLDLSILIIWMSPFRILGMSGVPFCVQTVQTLKRGVWSGSTLFA